MRRPADKRPTPDQFLTIAGRWRQAAVVSGMDRKFGPRDTSLCMLMFYSGFRAALEAYIELAEFADADAARLLQAMHHESDELMIRSVEILTKMARPENGRPNG